MTSTDTKKTPVAVLGGLRDEGLNSHIKKKESTPMISQPMTPAKCVKAQKEFDKLDLPALAQGTVLDLFHAAKKVGISPSDLLRQLDLEEDRP